MYNSKCWFNNKPKYDVEMYFQENENWPNENEPVYIVNKIIVNNLKMYEFYERINKNKNVELIKGFING